jgi:EAL domain-containing protein (putative c-di-GMP-specific phosphodiesterase class I)
LNTRIEEVRDVSPEAAAAEPLCALLIGFEACEVLKLEAAVATVPGVGLHAGPSHLPETAPSRACGRRYDLVLINRRLAGKQPGKIGSGAAFVSTGLSQMPGFAVGSVRVIDCERDTGDLTGTLQQAVTVCTERMRIFHDSIERAVHAAFSNQCEGKELDSDALLVMDNNGADVLYANAAACALGAFKLSQIARRAQSWQWPAVPIIVDEVMEPADAGAALTVTAAKVNVNGFTGLAFRFCGETALEPAEAHGKEANVVFGETTLTMSPQGIVAASLKGAPQWERTTGDDRHEIHEAFAREEFDVVFQPVFEALSCSLLGAEAFLRWTDSAGISHKPSQFLPRIEQAGLATATGRHVLFEACRLARLWHLIGHTDFHVSMNLSRAQLLGHGFLADVRATLTETGVSPAAVEFELSESVLVGDNRDVLACLSELAGLGSSIIFDDFGGGLDSLAYVGKLPLSGIKIAPRLTAGIDRNPEGRNIVAGMLELGRALRLSVGAKCVESVAQAFHLQRMKIGRMQGLLFAGGLPDDEFTDRFLWVCDPAH